MLPVKKIYIDSRFKSSDSVSDSNFKIDLPQNLLMPRGTGFYIDDICIPVSWYTIDEGRNNKLYFKVGSAMNIVHIPPGDYSLVNLNNAITTAMNSQGGYSFIADPNVSANKIGIKNNVPSSFEILTDEQLKSMGYSVPQSINNVLRNFTPSLNDSNTNYTWGSGYVDLVPIRNLYIVSSGLGSFNTMSVSGERSIVKKVPVNAGYGEMIFDQSLVGIDYLDCSHQALSRLSFQLKDVFGNIVDLHGQHISFSIVFSRISEIMN
jgi:hypothetical protein